MKVVLSGVSGLVGTKLIEELKGRHEIVRLVRRPPQDDFERQWNPGSGDLDPSVLEGCDCVIHLGGDNIAKIPWNAAKKQKIRDSRVHSTELLSKTMAAMPNRPATFVCASAIGYYGSRGDEVMTEDSAAGADFLAGVCKDWEDATRPASEAGVRVVNTRIGVVLAKHDGALRKMLTPFKLCGGGIVGDGKQYWSSVSLTELAKIIAFCAENETLSGPVNAVNPCAVTNREFTKTLGRILKRPTLVPMPAFLAKTLFGEMAEALLLSSTRVEPGKLKAAGYPFQFDTLEDCLRHELA